MEDRGHCGQILEQESNGRSTGVVNIGRTSQDATAGAEGVKRGSGARFGEVSGVIHFYYHAAPAGGRSGKLFLKQSGGLSSELLPACGRGRRGAYRG